MKMNNLEKNQYVKSQILKTLLEMMKEQPFDSIVITTLVQKAQVGRASFYRNYTSKEDVLRQEADRLTLLWGKQFESNPHENPNELLISLLDFYKEHSDFFLALYDAGLHQIVMETIISKVNITQDMPNAQAYVKSSCAYMIYGWLHEWIKRGMQESGTELAKMIEESQHNN